MAKALHGLHQVGQRRLQPLAADPVSRFPNHDQRLSHRLVVDASALFYRRLLLPIVTGLPQQPDAMLAMVAGHRQMLVPGRTRPESGFSPASMKLGSGLGSSPTFLFCHLTDASSHAIASPILDNILFEATTFVG